MPLEHVVGDDEHPVPDDVPAEVVPWDSKKMLADWRRSVARTRIAYRWTKDGRVQAVLSMTFPGNTRFVFFAECDPRTIIALMREQHPEVGGFSLKKLAKGIGKIAKKVASTKVFALASKALSVLAPIAGPLAPALLGAGAAMGASVKLMAAHKHAAAGNKEAAAALVKSAAEDAKAAPADAGGAPAALNAANAHAQKIYTLLLKPA
jgi:hypothetical protein